MVLLVDDLQVNQTTCCGGLVVTVYLHVYAPNKIWSVDIITNLACGLESGALQVSW